MIATMTPEEMIDAARHRYHTDPVFHAEVYRAATWALHDAPRLPDPEMREYAKGIAMDATLRALWLRDNDITEA